MERAFYKSKTFWAAILAALAAVAKVYQIDIPEELLNTVMGFLVLYIPGQVAWDRTKKRKVQKEAVAAGWMISDAGPVASPSVLPPQETTSLDFLDSESVPSDSDSWMVDSTTDWEKFYESVAYVEQERYGVRYGTDNPIAHFIAFREVGSRTPCEAWADAFKYSDELVEATDAAFLHLFKFSLDAFKENPKKYLLREDKPGCHWTSLESMARRTKRLSMLRATKEAHREAEQLERASELKPMPDIRRFRSLAGALEYAYRMLPVKPVEYYDLGSVL